VWRCGADLDLIVRRLYLALGTTDGDPQCRPTLHIFVGSKAPWHEITDALPQHEAWTYDTESD